MKILLEQVITGDTGQRITWIDSTIDNERDAVNAYDTIEAFEAMLIASGTFADNDHMALELNGDGIGYAELLGWEDLVAFLGGSL